VKAAIILSIIFLAGSFSSPLTHNSSMIDVAYAQNDAAKQAQEKAKEASQKQEKSEAESQQGQSSSQASSSQQSSQSSGQQQTPAQKVDKKNLIYNIIGGTVSAIEADEYFASLIITLEAEDDGILTITLPRSFIDAKIGDIDDEFFVLVNGEEIVYFEEAPTIDDRILVISFEQDTREIEIIGTQISIAGLKPEPAVPSMPSETTQESEDVVPTQENDGGCLIATAAFGSELAPQVQLLREIRDNTVLSTASGTSFMTTFNSFYYSFSPAVADLERQNPAFKETVKIAITPLLSSLSLLQYVNIDSEAEMLGYGIGIILLNIGMYFVAPALIVFKLKNRK